MKIVAEKLSEIAIGERNDDRFDLFGRSAFNRYYYASYLIVREMLKNLNAEWEEKPHSQIPDLLCIKIANHFRKAISKQRLANIISDDEANTVGSMLNTALADIASLLKSAYRVRCVADYSPSSRLKRGGRSFELFDHSIDEAKKWPNRVERGVGVILRIWRSLGSP